jgi:predicted ATP-grasp superfamily ATP-dependent carboligase
MRLLLAGVSVRAFAQSAVAAGHDVVAVDAYGDLDLREIAEVMVVPPPYTAMAAAEAARGVACDAVAYTSNFENHPEALALLAAGRTLLGNAPDVVARVRAPGFLAGSPAVRTTPASAGDWLLKPLASGGGHGIRPWRVGGKVPRGMFLQERVEGVPGSVLFDGTTVLGTTRQLIGDPAFGGSEFKYCGNILLDRPAPALPALGLRGMHGIDFIERDGVAVPIEVNPRYTAAMELIGRRDREKAIVGKAIVGKAIVGKAIVYARRAVTMGDTREWLGDESVADIPVPGTRVPRGRPICTVFASGRDVEECYARLVARADQLYAAVERRRVAA